MASSLEGEVKKVSQNEPYIGIVCCETNHQFFVVIERNVTIECNSFADALTDMICAYFVFDITYPKPVLYFIQRFIFNIKHIGNCWLDSSLKLSLLLIC